MLRSLLVPDPDPDRNFIETTTPDSDPPNPRPPDPSETPGDPGDVSGISDDEGIDPGGLDRTLPAPHRLLTRENLQSLFPSSSSNSTAHAAHPPATRGGHGFPVSPTFSTRSFLGSQQGGVTDDDELPPAMPPVLQREDTAGDEYDTERRAAQDRAELMLAGNQALVFESGLAGVMRAQRLQQEQQQQQQTMRSSATAEPSSLRRYHSSPSNPISRSEAVSPGGRAAADPPRPSEYEYSDWYREQDLIHRNCVHRRVHERSVLLHQIETRALRAELEGLKSKLQTTKHTQAIATSQLQQAQKEIQRLVDLVVALAGPSPATSSRDYLQHHREESLPQEKGTQEGSSSGDLDSDPHPEPDDDDDAGVSPTAAKSHSLPSLSSVPSVQRHPPQPLQQKRSRTQNNSSTPLAGSAAPLAILPPMRLLSSPALFLSQGSLSPQQPSGAARTKKKKKTGNAPRKSERSSRAPPARSGFSLPPSSSSASSTTREESYHPFPPTGLPSRQVSSVSSVSSASSGFPPSDGVSLSSLSSLASNASSVQSRSSQSSSLMSLASDHSQHSQLTHHHSHRPQLQQLPEQQQGFPSLLAEESQEILPHHHPNHFQPPQSSSSSLSPPTSSETGREDHFDLAVPSVTLPPISAEFRESLHLTPGTPEMPLESETEQQRRRIARTLLQQKTVKKPDFPRSPVPPPTAGDASSQADDDHQQQRSGIPFPSSSSSSGSAPGRAEISSPEENLHQDHSPPPELPQLMLFRQRTQPREETYHRQQLQLSSSSCTSSEHPSSRSSTPQPTPPDFLPSDSADEGEEGLEAEQAEDEELSLERDDRRNGVAGTIQGFDQDQNDHHHDHLESPTLTGKQNSEAALQEALRIQRIWSRKRRLQEEEDNQRREDERRSRDCVCCFSSECTVVFLPCAHMCTCLACSQKITECPICRDKICHSIRVYF